MKAKKIYKTLFLGISMAWLSVSGIFLTTMIGLKRQDLALLFLFFPGFLYGLCTVSRNSDIGLIRFLISMPFAFLTCKYYSQTDLIGRAKHHFYPNGCRAFFGPEIFGMGVMGIGILLYICIGGICTYGVNIPEEKLDRFEKKQLAAIIIADISAAAAVVISEIIFPAVKSIA